MTVNASDDDYLTLANFLSYEKINENDSKKFSLPLLQYRNNLNIYSETMASLIKNCDKKTNLWLEIIMFRLIGTLQSIRILKLKGYYFESNILTRNFYETFRSLCFSKRKS